MMCSFRLIPPSLLSAGPACLGALLAFLFTTALQGQAAEKWGQGVPKPEFFMHRSEELPRASRLNGEKLADEVEKLLGADSVAGTRP